MLGGEQMVEQGNIIDEAKNNPQSCQLVARIKEGGQGFESIECCGNTLTATDLADTIEQHQRTGGDIQPGTIIDESKNYPNSCGLKIELVEGGAGLAKINCCGNELTVEKDSAE